MAIPTLPLARGIFGFILVLVLGILAHAWFFVYFSVIPHLQAIDPRQFGRRIVTTRVTGSSLNSGFLVVEFSFGHLRPRCVL